MAEAGGGSGSDSDDDLSHLLRFDTEEEFFAAASANAACYFRSERHIVLDEEALASPDATVFTFRQRGEGKEHLADNTGGAIYDAAILLGRHLARSEAAVLKGARVLELGSGPAFTAAVCARLIGEEGSLLATDGEPTSVELARENLLVSGAHPDRVGAARYWWGTPIEEIPELKGKEWDVVIAADVAYTDEVLGPLVEALRVVCSSKTTAFLCNGSRSWKRERSLRNALREHFTLSEIDTTDLTYVTEREAPGQGAGAASAEAGAGGSGAGGKVGRREMHRYMLLWRLTPKKKE
ncbi:putative methyltransferase-domain-containing protein [Baffinella frigidus]|nr:putative methyltransferase-domain-containing protein [Cryptophyta sp. CCMP2293]